MESSSKNEYMREYMANKYKKDPVRNSQYRNSCRVKAKLGLSDAEFDKYKHYLADIIKIKTICERVPIAMVEELIADINKAQTC